MTAGILSGQLRASHGAVAVIMAGGQGTRFWPRSREGFPKQFLEFPPLGRSLLQETARRVEPLSGASGVLVATAKRYLEETRKQLPAAAILTEPIAKNTAPCIGLAALHVLHTVGDLPMLCLPADHLVTGIEGLLRAYQVGIEIAKSSETLVTFGITPAHAETGYGYIHRGESHSAQRNGPAVFRVRQFVEKPQLRVAEDYVASGEYYWNSGMFVWRPSVIRNAISECEPKLGEALDRIDKAIGTPREQEVTLKEFEAMASVSIDFGVLERSKSVVVVPSEDYSWSDVGSWSAWAECMGEQADSQGNVAEHDTIFVSSKNNAVFGKERFVACIGIDNLVIVDSEDALLICSRGRTQEVKKIVEYLREGKRDKLL